MKKIITSLLLCGVCTVLSAQTPPITPAWGFRHIVWEDSINTSASAKRIVDLYLERDIPVGSIIVDSPWSNTYNDFDWDEERYPNADSMIKYFKDKSVRVILWLTGNVNQKSRDTRLQKSPLLDEAIAKNYGVDSSKIYHWWKGDGIHIDFTQKEATQWWYKQLDKVFGNGVCGWKVDQGEMWLGKKVLTSKGEMSNEDFRHYYYDAMYDYTVGKDPEGMIIGRPYSHQGGYAASVERLNMGWCGDFAGNWKGLKSQIDNIYRSSLRGYGAVGCEVAGFYSERAEAKQFARYAQFGCMTATMINGGENGAFSNHLPWYHGKEIEDIYRFCVNLHHQLIPYMFSTVVDAHLHGGSLLKNPSLSQESHMLGNDVFTKAITSDEETVTFSLPEEGQWVDFWSGKVYAAGTSITQAYPVSQFPLFMRSGSIIPMKIQSTVTGIGSEKMQDGLTLLVTPNGKTSRLLHLPLGEGTEYEDCMVSFDQEKRTFSLKRKTSQKTYVIINNMPKVKKVRNVEDWSYSDGTLTFSFSGNDAGVTIVL